MKDRLVVKDQGAFFKDALSNEVPSDPKGQSKPGKDIIKLAKGSKVMSMGKTNNGYLKCKYGGKIIWVKNSDLVEPRKES